jgi:hypothetical protein
MFEEETLEFVGIIPFDRRFTQNGIPKMIMTPNSIAISHTYRELTNEQGSTKFYKHNDPQRHIEHSLIHTIVASKPQIVSNLKQITKKKHKRQRNDKRASLCSPPMQIPRDA